MKCSSRFLRAALIITATLGTASHLSAETYHASFLGQPDEFSIYVQGISGSNVVGAKINLDSGLQAYLWNASTGSALSLNPAPEWSTAAYGTSFNTQVGYGYTSTTPDYHAVLWHSISASFVDLNPVGFYTSQAYGVSGNNQVGKGGQLSESQSHALLWHGTAASAVDLNPAGYVGSTAQDVDGDNIIGTVGTSGNGQFAGLWQGTAHTFTNLQPAGFGASIGLAISQNSEVGFGFLGAPFSTPMHALLWHGTAASAIDLNPGSGFANSQANDVSGNLQVGYGSGTATGGNDHALFWKGTAASVFDLQSLLGPEFASSQATGVNEDGVIVGTATDTLNRHYAVVWSPVPEPSSALLALLGGGLLIRRRRRWATQAGWACGTRRGIGLSGRAHP